MTAVWLFLRTEARQHWRAWLSLALIIGVISGGVLTSAAGALRTSSAYSRFLEWSRPPDSLVFADPYDPSFARLPPAAVMRIPQAADAAVIKTFNVSPGTIQFFAPAGDAIPGRFWKRKILSGRLADPARPGEVNVSFTLAQRFHLRPGDPLRLVMKTKAHKPVPIVFHVAGIDAAQMEFPPQPGNGTYVAWGTPAFYQEHRSLDGFAQVALRLQHGVRDWPAVQRDLNDRTHPKLVSAALLTTQSVNTQRSIAPQATALWLLAALFGVIGLLLVGQLLARMSFLEATEYSTWRALGMRRTQLMTVCLGRAAAIGAAGGLIAGALGVALSPLMPVGLAGVAEPHPGVDANVGVLVIGLAATLVVTVGCAIWPGWRAAAEGPPTRLSGGAPSPQRPRGVASRLATARPIPLGMGVRLALHRGAGRTAVPVRSAIASATVGVAALTAAIVFAASLSFLLATPALYGVTWDAIAVNDAGGDIRPIVATVKDDRRVAAWTTAGAGAPLRAGHTDFEAIVLPVRDSTSFISEPVSGRLPRTSREIALGTNTLRQLHTRIGATIQVSLIHLPERPMTVVGTTVFPTLSDQLGLGTGAALTPGGARYLVPQATLPLPGDVFIRFRPGITPESGRQALAAQLAPFGSFSVDGPATPTDLLSFGEVQDMPQVLGIGLAVVALLTIAHLLLTSVRRRRRDFAIFRTLGFTTWQVRGTLGWQAVTLAAITLVIGVPAGIVCGRLGWQVFADQLGVTPVTAVPVTALSIMAAGWLAAAVIIAALPGRAAVRNSPATLLRSE